MKQQLLHYQLSVLEAFAKVNQSGHKCNTEIKELIELVKVTLDEVVIELESEDEEQEEEV